MWGCNASIGGGSCAPPGKAVMGVYGNQIYRESGRSCPFSSGCDVACGMDSSNASMLSMADFQAKCGLGDGAAVHPVPSATEIAAWSRELLAIPTLLAEAAAAKAVAAATVRVSACTRRLINRWPLPA